MACVRIENEFEKEYLIELLNEFGNKCLVRNVGPQTDYGHYAIKNVTDSENLDDMVEYYEINMSEHYVQFIDYLIAKKRNLSELCNY